jgi:predicted transcriptional regulator
MIVGRLSKLKFKQATIGLVLILIIGGCMVASVYQQENSKLAFLPDGNLQVLLATPLLGVYVQGLNQPSVNSTRMDIYNYIDVNPGIQFRGVCAGLALPVGLVQYHLSVLVKSGLLSFVHDGKYKRFFVSKKFSKKQIAAITMLRHKTAKRIFEVLLTKKQLSHGKLADELAISSQALTWQMKSLRNTKFVLQVNDGLKIIYSINESTMPLLETSIAIVR